MLKLTHALGFALIAGPVMAIVPHSVATTAEQKMASGGSYDPPRMVTTGKDEVIVLVAGGGHIILPGTVDTVGAEVDEQEGWFIPPNPPKINAAQ